MDFRISQANWLAVAGLWWDIAGALMLARALFAVTPKRMLMQASTGWSFSPNLVWAFCEQRVDARFGATLLTAGFLMQMASSAGAQVPVIGAAIIVAVLVLITGWYFARRELFVARAHLACVTLQPNVPEDQAEKLHVITMRAMGIRD